MIRALHLTDLHVAAHLSAPGARQTDTLATLDRVLAALPGLDPAPDVVVVSGDLTDHGDAASYRLLAGRLARLDLPVILALGNHDRRAPFRAAFPGHPGDAEAPLDHHRLVAGLHVIVLDSSVPHRVGGALDDGQIRFLDDALGAHPTRPKLLVIHHPPAPRDGGAVWHCLDPGDSETLARTIAGRGVRLILSGHVHLNRMRLWHGIPAITAIGQNATVDALHETTRAGGLRIVEGTGFALCDIREDEVAVTFVPIVPGLPIRSIPPVALARLR